MRDVLQRDAEHTRDGRSERRRPLRGPQAKVQANRLDGPDVEPHPRRLPIAQNDHRNVPPAVENGAAALPRQQRRRERQGVHVRVPGAVLERDVLAVHELPALFDGFVVRLVRADVEVRQPFRGRDGVVHGQRRLAVFDAVAERVLELLELHIVRAVRRIGAVRVVGRRRSVHAAR